MEEFFALLKEVWSLLSREEKEAAIVLAGSFPLGALGIGIGIYDDQSTLFWLGLLNLVIGTLLILFMGAALITVFILIAKALLKGVLWLITWPFRNKQTQKEPDAPQEDSSPPNESQDDEHAGFAFLDMAFTIWLFVAMIQMYQIFKYFFPA